jgi:hypothetical protein
MADSDFDIAKMIAKTVAKTALTYQDSAKVLRQKIWNFNTSSPSLDEILDHPVPAGHLSLRQNVHSGQYEMQLGGARLNLSDGQLLKLLEAYKKAVETGKLPIDAPLDGSRLPSDNQEQLIKAFKTAIEFVKNHQDNKNPLELEKDGITLHLYGDLHPNLAPATPLVPSSPSGRSGAGLKSRAPSGPVETDESGSLDKLTAPLNSKEPPPKRRLKDLLAPPH